MTGSQSSGQPQLLSAQAANQLGPIMRWAHGQMQGDSGSVARFVGDDAGQYRAKITGYTQDELYYVGDVYDNMCVTEIEHQATIYCDKFPYKDRKIKWYVPFPIPNDPEGNNWVAVEQWPQLEGEEWVLRWFTATDRTLTCESAGKVAEPPGPGE